MTRRRATTWHGSRPGLFQELLAARGIAPISLRMECTEPVLAVGADPDSNLGPLLGAEPDETIGELRDDMLKAIKKRAEA